MKKIKKIHFIFDETKKNIKLRNFLLKKNRNHPPKSSNVLSIRLPIEPIKIPSRPASEALYP